MREQWRIQCLEEAKMVILLGQCASEEQILARCGNAVLAVMAEPPMALLSRRLELGRCLSASSPSAEVPMTYVTAPFAAGEQGTSVLLVFISCDLSGVVILA